MSNVIGVHFRTAGKIYWYDAGEHELKRGDAVIVETSRGKEYGTVVVPPHEASERGLNQPLKEILRPANRIDIEQETANREKEKDAFRICREKIAERGLEMKLINAEYTFDNTKILFYFTADGRVDFRELVKELAATFHTRIELRQVGVRDETKMIGGYGICGRDLCCHAYLPDFSPVSIKMAKEQNLSLNPTKISGSCGRLMCCLNNEEEVYEEINKRMPGVGDTATATADGLTGIVFSVDILRETARIVVDVGDEREIHEYPVSELDFVKSNHRRRKKPKIDLRSKPDQKVAKEQAIKNAREQAIQAAMERQQQEQESGASGADARPDGEGGGRKRNRNRRRDGAERPAGEGRNRSGRGERRQGPEDRRENAGRRDGDGGSNAGDRRENAGRREGDGANNGERRNNRNRSRRRGGGRPQGGEPGAGGQAPQ
ncbi:MAG: hypothetical protein IKO80_04630 [Lachnospiraceae bacterium]|nr:hypothetical protein [Lachnospiraceae bacterium]